VTWLFRDSRGHRVLVGGPVEKLAQPLRQCVRARETSGLIRTVSAVSSPFRSTWEPSFSGRAPPRELTTLRRRGRCQPTQEGCLDTLFYPKTCVGTGNRWVLSDSCASYWPSERLRDRPASLRSAGQGLLQPPVLLQHRRPWRSNQGRAARCGSAPGAPATSHERPVAGRPSADAGTEEAVTAATC